MLDRTCKKIYLTASWWPIWKFQYQQAFPEAGEIPPAERQRYRLETIEHAKLQLVAFTDEKRDFQLGHRRIVLEEFIETLLRVPHVLLIPLKLNGLIMSVVYMPWKAVFLPIRVGLLYRLENHGIYDMLQDGMSERYSNFYTIHTKGLAIVLHIAFDVVYVS